MIASLQRSGRVEDVGNNTGCSNIPDPIYSTWCSAARRSNWVNLLDAVMTIGDEQLAPFLVSPMDRGNNNLLILVVLEHSRAAHPGAQHPPTYRGSYESYRPRRRATDSPLRAYFHTHISDAEPDARALPLTSTAIHLIEWSGATRPETSTLVCER